MKGQASFLTIVILAASLAVAACGQAAPPTGPTPSPVPSTKAPEPTKVAPTPTRAAEAPKPTAAPAKKVEFPEKGKPVSLIIPFSAGGGGDIGARLLAPHLERELGTPVQVINRPGAGSQVGVTEIAKAKPDGYTYGLTNIPTTITIYLDPSRQAAFSRKDFQTVALHVVEPTIIGVRADSPIKSLKDLVDAAKANPGKINVGVTGILAHQHLALLQLQRLADVKFNLVVFDGSAPGITALLGGHIDAQFSTVAPYLSQFKSGTVRILAVLDTRESASLPGVKTAEAQGYKLYNQQSRGWSVPTGTPREIVDILSLATKRAMETDEHKKSMEEQGLELRYMDPDQFGAYWDQMEAEVQPLMEEALRDAAK